MVSNIYLNKIGKYSKNCQGSFSCNSIKKLKFKNDISTYIFNLSKLNGPGTHLAAVQINSINKKTFYFDSFSLPCTNKDILEFICTVNNKYAYNALQIQHFESIYCGMYCLAFVMYHETSSKFTNF